MRWWTLGAVEVGFSRTRLVVGLVGEKITRLLVDWSW